MPIPTGTRGSLFQSPSLVWLEEREEDVDHTRVQNVDINPATWSLQNTDQVP